MSRHSIVALAVVFVLGSSGLATSAFAQGGGHGSGGHRFRGHHYSDGFGGAPRHCYFGHAGGLSGGFCEYGARDVWGHWGGYYGPMVP
jgi:hypothetical protein